MIAVTVVAEEAVEQGLLEATARLAHVCLMGAMESSQTSQAIWFGMQGE